jgi:hypothetical protein
MRIYADDDAAASSMRGTLGKCGPDDPLVTGK